MDIYVFLGYKVMYFVLFDYKYIIYHYVVSIQARMVAAATHSLCEAANAMVQGHASEEQLISSAKQVAGSTAQLLVACKVKADPDSVAMKRLQAAGECLAV